MILGKSWLVQVDELAWLSEAQEFRTTSDGDGDRVLDATRM